MNRHLPYLCGALKLPFCLAVLAWLVLSGEAARLALLAESRAGSGALMPFAMVWLFHVMGLMILVFPLDVLEEHFLRVQEGEPEEMPAAHWLSQFSWDLGIRVAAGFCISTAMLYLGDWWWIVLSMIWISYQAFIPLVQSAYLKSSESGDGETRTEEAHPELVAALAQYGIRVDHLVDVDEEDMSHITPDIYYVTRRGKTRMYIPRAWIQEWTQPELVAAALHKARMNRTSILAGETLLNVMMTLLALGGYSLIDPVIRPYTGARTMASPEAVPVIISWLIVSTAVLKTGGFLLVRRWIFSADDAVVRQAGSAEGLLAALKRAEASAGSEPPAWAEILFAYAPSNGRRIARLETNASAQ